jgi:hypothetical protein
MASGSWTLQWILKFENGLLGHYVDWYPNIYGYLVNIGINKPWKPLWLAFNVCVSRIFLKINDVATLNSLKIWQWKISFYLFPIIISKHHIVLGDKGDQTSKNMIWEK